MFSGTPLGFLTVFILCSQPVSGGERAARERGLDWLLANQAANGSWGKTYTVSVTSFACLSFLGASEEPFKGDRGKALVRGIQFLLSMQQDGMFAHQGHTWIHGQGFGTLALSEAYGRTLFCEVKPDIDVEKIRTTVLQAVRLIAEHQSTSGGWWYTPNSKENHEGSTTCCAVQALVSADNFGVEIDESVLSKGFEYLKQCQNPDGGFDYKLGPGTTSMKEGTAGGVSTLGLMKKFDYAVMMNGSQFLFNVTASAIGSERFPYYGHFYGAMGMRLLGLEMSHLRDKTKVYGDGVLEQLVSWQEPAGSWPIKGWMHSNGQEGAAYATAYSTLTLSISDGLLSIFNREAPRLPPRD